jgi:RHS repeat-associated protein
LEYVTRQDSSVRSYVFDNSDRITSDGVYSYAYNPLGRLIKVEQGTTTVAEYAYDPFGRRIKKTVSGTTTHFHHDLQGRLIAETAGDGTPLRDYVYQNGNLVVIKLHGTQAGMYYVISDHLGTPQQIVDSTGTVVWKAAFLPFGKAQILTETITNNIRFPGQYFDAETGLHYNWNRYYDPETSRYLTADPIGLTGGLNLYAYVGGDPVNGIDPWGLTKIDVDIKNGTMTVDPEKKGQASYQMPITSGRGECTNDPVCSNKEDKGPIPPGNYSAKSGDLTDPGVIGDIARNIRGDWGDWRVPVKPSKGTKTHGRSGFFLHGGRLSGSAGCIDFGGGLFGDDTTDKLKKDILNDPDGVIPIKIH